MMEDRGKGKEAEGVEAGGGEADPEDLQLVNLARIVSEASGLSAAEAS